MPHFVDFATALPKRPVSHRHFSLNLPNFIKIACCCLFWHENWKVGAGKRKENHDTNDSQWP
jgi:hypothetical protein